MIRLWTTFWIILNWSVSHIYTPTTTSLRPFLSISLTGHRCKSVFWRIPGLPSFSCLCFLLRSGSTCTMNTSVHITAMLSFSLASQQSFPFRPSVDIKFLYKKTLCEFSVFPRSNLCLLSLSTISSVHSLLPSHLSRRLSSRVLFFGSQVFINCNCPITRNPTLVFIFFTLLPDPKTGLVDPFPALRRLHPPSPL